MASVTPSRGPLKGQTFATKYAYRNALAQYQGFQSEYHKRKASRFRAVHGRGRGLQSESFTPFAGRTPEGDWRIIAWRSQARWYDLRKHEREPRRETEVEYIIVRLPDGRVRQFRVMFGPLYGWYDFLGDVFGSYGVALAA